MATRHVSRATSDVLSARYLCTLANETDVDTKVSISFAAEDIMGAFGAFLSKTVEAGTTLHITHGMLPRHYTSEQALADGVIVTGIRSISDDNRNFLGDLDLNSTIVITEDGLQLAEAEQ